MSRTSCAAGPATKTSSSRADYIRRLVDAAPPLSHQQRARLRGLLKPELGRIGEQSRPQK